MGLEWLLPLWRGFSVTLQFFAITLIISLPLGMLMAVLLRFMPKNIKLVIQTYVYVFRGTPLLLQMMFVFFGLPYLNIVLGRYESAVLTLVLNYTAYFIEIFRGGIQAVPVGQFEAFKVLSIKPWVGWYKVILPQVWRIVMPSDGNEVITLIKDTSLIYVLGLEDLLKVGRSLSNQNATLLPYVYVGVVYLAFTAIATVILRKIEQKMEV